MDQKRREPTLKKPPCGGRGSTPFIERLQRDPFEVIEDERAAHKQYTPSLPRFVRVTRAEGFVIGFPAGMPKAKT